jgi:hypothetical protein
MLPFHKKVIKSLQLGRHSTALGAVDFQKLMKITLKLFNRLHSVAHFEFLVDDLSIKLFQQRCIHLTGKTVIELVDIPCFITEKAVKPFVRLLN